MSSKSLSSIDALNRLLEALSETNPVDKEELKKSLNEEGIDAEAVVKDGLAFVRKLQGKAKIELSKRSTLLKVAMVKEKIRALVPNLTQANKEMLAGILFGEKASLSVNFSKLNKLTDEDIADMIEEVKLLEFLESLEKKD